MKTKINQTVFTILRYYLYLSYSPQITEESVVRLYDVGRLRAEEEDYDDMDDDDDNPDENEGDFTSFYIYIFLGISIWISRVFLKNFI